MYVNEMGFIHHVLDGQIDKFNHGVHTGTKLPFSVIVRSHVCRGVGASLPGSFTKSLVTIGNQPSIATIGRGNPL